MRHRHIVLHVGLAVAAALAAVGVWFLWSDYTEVPAWVGIPLTAKVLFIALAVTARVTRARAYNDGVATAQIDPQTRLASPELAEKVLALEFAAAERGRELTVVLFSIDNFSRLAVLEGGAMRDTLLRNAGAALRRRTRGMNLSARHTVEGQFISVLGGADVEGALTFAARVRKDFGSIKTGAAQPIVSAVACSYEPGMESTAVLLHNLEAALAKAKRTGNGDIGLATSSGLHLRSSRPAYDTA